MKRTELMIGNWVIAPDGVTKELKEIKVAIIKENGIITNKYYDTIFIETISPIPITEDFLIANGFEQKWLIEPDEFYPLGLCEWEKETDEHFLSIRKCANKLGCDWCIRIDNADRDSVGCLDIQYVHQFQNVLNILEIEMEVNV